MNYEELVNNNAGKMIGELLTALRAKANIDIRFDYSDTEQWSVVSMHTDEDNEISLRVHADKSTLYFGYYDEDDDFLEIIKVLTPEEVNLVPKGLKKAMDKVLADEEGMRFPASLMSK
ncbi:hypothetical protein F0L74_20615 [Chitinophaga agrisoli]|uniref:Uncharacterized protein n=1 Tax=Chitinophaga agrisoli TaxID=2607653 RepID=A0A5B2VJB4_9BACT|nr:hypothetical protein [Chitinophaga agrisoli]KAA2238630.1 hypothetical protein F0L74_20615 [Chitinophaga agrisoli]